MHTLIRLDNDVIYNIDILDHPSVVSLIITLFCYYVSFLLYEIGLKLTPLSMTSLKPAYYDVEEADVIRYIKWHGYGSTNQNRGLIVTEVFT